MSDLSLNDSRWQINKAFISDNTIKVAMFNRKTLFPRKMYEEFTKAATMAIIFLLLLLGPALLTYLLTDSEYSFASALFESGSAQGTDSRII